MLDVYTRPYDPKRPVVCMDELSRQLIGETRIPLPVEPGQVERYDYEYVRHGVANLFLFFEPLVGWRWVRISERRRKREWAESIRELVDQRYPEAERIVLVLDNLNTHTPAALYECFEPAEAKRIADRLEIHYTPKHGSWLNMAEIELSVLERQLQGRIEEIEMLESAVRAWEAERNAQGASVNWQFTTEDARIKLQRLYPSIDL